MDKHSSKYSILLIMIGNVSYLFNCL